MTRRLCDVGFCDRTGATWVWTIQDRESVELMCVEHAQEYVEQGLGEKVSAVKAQAIRLGTLPDEDAKCDAEDCDHTATTYIRWKLDEDDDDEVIGHLCFAHANDVLARGHGELIDEDEALEEFNATLESWEELWAALDEWYQTLEDDLESDIACLEACDD